MDVRSYELKLLDNLLEGCQIIDYEWCYQYLNDAAVEHSHKTREELIGQTMMAAYPGIENTEMFATLEGVMRDRRDARIENEFTYPDGSTGWFELHVEPCNEGILILSEDITDRKLAESELQSNLLRFRALHEIDKAITSSLEFDQILKIILEETSRIIRCDSITLQELRNQSLEIVACLGFDKPQKVKDLVFHLDLKFPNTRVVLDSTPLLIADVRKVSPHLKPKADWSFYGNIRSWMGVPLLLEGTPIGMIAFERTSIDPFTPAETETAVTFASQTAIALHHAQLYENLKISESSYRSIFEGVQDAIFVGGPAGEILDVNDQACELLGYGKEELLELNVQELVPPGYPSASPNGQSGSSGSAATIETANIHANGEIIPVEITARFQEIGEQTVQLMVVRDIRERTKALEQINRYIAQLESLRQIDLAITGIRDLESILEVFLEHLTEQLEVDAACVLLLEPEAKSLNYFSKRGFRTDALQFTSLPPGKGFAGKVAQSGKPLMVLDLKDKPGDLSKSKDFSKEGFEFYGCAPLIAHSNVRGVVEVFHRSPKSPNEEWIDFFGMLATQAAIAIDQATLYSELEAYSAGLERAVQKATSALGLSNERLEAILNNSPDTILLLTTENRITLVNRVVESLFGYEPGELDGAELQRLVQPEAGPLLEQMIERVLESAEPVGSEVNALRRDGTSFSAQFVLSPLKHEGTITAIVCTIRDITEWVRLRQMKDAFVSNVSHELRTPITSLRLNYGLMKRDPAQSDKYLNRFDREITRLDELIEDLLRLSRLDQGQVDLKSEPIQLNEMAAATVADRTPIAESNELKLTFLRSSQAPLVIADAGLLNQVLNVFLTNAINYTPPGGHIEVRIEHELTDGGAWAGFSIKDDGLGIDPEERALLFERFYRGKAGRDSGAPGTGLGLAIAAEIVRRHHGRIEVDSKGIPGEGSTFTVWLAAAEEDNLPSE